MQDQLCHCADHHIPPISAVGSPDLPEVPASPKYFPEFHTPSIEVQSLGTVSLAPATPGPILVPPPIASPLPPSNVENIPPACCSNPPPSCAPLVPIEEVMSNAEDLDTIAERMEEALEEEVALSFEQPRARSSSSGSVFLITSHTPLHSSNATRRSSTKEKGRHL